MKIQYLAIIFLIVIIPMTLVLTIYNQSQVNNLNLQLIYNTYLSDATHNAVKAFELNTVNNKYSQVADSLKRDVEASVNVFLTSMAKSLGTSGATAESVSEYVPAVLFTLYDGYYIYAPSYSEELVETTIPKENLDGTMGEVIVPKSQDPKVENFSHIVKPYVYYSMRYTDNKKNDFIVNYSLDNYMTIYGKVNNNYVTKAGYLLEVNSYNTQLKGIDIKINQDKLLPLLKKDVLSYKLAPRALDEASVDEINNVFDNENKKELKNYINYSGGGVYRTSLISGMGETLLDNILNRNYNENNPILLKDIPIAKIDQKFTEEVDEIKVSNTEIIDEVLDCFTVKYGEHEITDSDAKSYYVKGLQFSNWVNNNLNTITIQDARDSKGNEIDIFSGRTDAIFNTKTDNNPEKLDSVFSQHKNEVIKQSIQSNLTSSIARYNQSYFGLKHGYDLKMPKLNEVEWKAITNKVTMVTFMQGMIVGNKVFNDYSIVSSDRNKELVEENEIYYFNKNSAEKIYYHRLDCPKLKEDSEKKNAQIVGYKAIEYDIYKSKNDKGELEYEYGEEIEAYRKNKNSDIIELSADYECLVDGNYKPSTTISKTLELAKRIAVAREKNKHYKVNAYLDSSGVQYEKTHNDTTAPSVIITNGSISPNSIELNVSAEETQSGIAKYEIYVIEKDDQDNIREDFEYSNKSSKTAVFHRLKEGTKYNCYAKVYDEAGNVGTSESLEITTTTHNRGI